MRASMIRSKISLSSKRYAQRLFSTYYDSQSGLHVAVHNDGVTATKFLRDARLFTFGKRHSLTHRHNRRLNVAAQSNCICSCHDKFYSVETTSPSPFTADIAACHGKIAHLTRAGYLCTPVNTASLPRSPVGVLPVVTISRTGFKYSHT